MPRDNIRFDFALSFAGPQRDVAVCIRNALTALHQRVFYDRDFEHEMIGRNGVEYLRHVYSRESRFCIVLLSPDYDQGRWTRLEKESIEGRELRGDEGVLIPVRVSDYAPAWLPETRIYFDLTSRTVRELATILARMAAGNELALSFVESQDDLYWALPGTTWRKANGVEQVIFDYGGLLYNNHAGHPKWRENYYRIDKEFRKITVTWTVDGFTTPCQFNDSFSVFTEAFNRDDGVWSLLSIKPNSPRWGV
jgi:hypothetical protein